MALYCFTDSGECDAQSSLPNNHQQSLNFYQDLYLKASYRNSVASLTAAYTRVSSPQITQRMANQNIVRPNTMYGAPVRYTLWLAFVLYRLGASVITLCC